MLRLRNLVNKNQKRLIRPLYAQSQATPYAANLHSSLRSSDGSIRVPASGDTSNTATNPFGTTRTATASTLKNSIIPGLVVARSTGEDVGIATGGNTAEYPFGLLANFVGGDLDDGYSTDSLLNSVGVWRGPDAVFELLAPAFDDTGLAAAFAASSQGVPVKLFAQADGRLGSATSGSNQVVVAHLVDRPSASRIVIDLKV